MSGGAESANPYVGLRPFERRDSLFFFGRREQVAELLEQLRGHRFLAVVGSSGCGKSSLIRAGLVPALLGGFLVEERDRWQIAEMKPGDAPLRNLATALAAAVGGGERQDEIEALHRAIAEEPVEAAVSYLRERTGGGANVLLLVDQFEEIFGFRGSDNEETLAEPAPETRRARARRQAEAAGFVHLLLELARRQGLPVYVVLTMRTDFLGDCDLFYGLPEAMNQGRYLVPRLNRQQLRQAIEGPALLSETRLAPRLLDRLLNELGDRSDRLPVLQHALARTWEAWRQNGTGGPIDIESYRAAGTLENSLSQHAEEALEAEDLKTTERIFKRLTDSDPNRRRVRCPARLSELVAVAGAPRASVEAILERFRGDGRHFVVLSESAEPGDPRVDISHESLIRRWPRLRTWVDEELRSREPFEELVRAARRRAAGEAGLLTQPALGIALDWRRSARPKAAWARRYSRRDDDFAVAMNYLDRSAERQATRRGLAVAVPGFLYWFFGIVMSQEKNLVISSLVLSLPAVIAFLIWARPRLGRWAGLTTLGAAAFLGVSALIDERVFLVPAGIAAMLLLALVVRLHRWQLSLPWRPVGGILALLAAAFAFWALHGLLRTAESMETAGIIVLYGLFIGGFLLVVAVPLTFALFGGRALIQTLNAWWRRRRSREALLRAAEDAAAFEASAQAQACEARNPYVGLRPFESRDSLLFFGRREPTAELLEGLHRSRFLAVVGSSGCGKSSLIRAGLVPALLGGFLVEERDRWRIATMKPGDAPLRRLAAALCEAGGSAAAEAESAALAEALTQRHAQAVIDYLAPRLGDQGNLLLLVDQFEEIFAFRGLESEEQLAELAAEQRRRRALRRAEASDFVHLLLELGRQEELPIYTVITMRTDFLGDCDLFYGLPEAMNRGRYLVPRLNRRQLRRAIEGPALLSGTRLAPRLVDHLANELGDRMDRLPVLQHALARTWQAWCHGDGGGVVDFEHYRAVGTLEGALSRHAETALRHDDLAATEKIFQRLTDTDANHRRVRRPGRLSELAAVSGASREEVEAILERFRGGGRHFVVLSEGADEGDPRVDIAHESLIRQWERLRRWVDDELASRTRFVELVRGARREAAGQAPLLKNPELRLALKWRAARKPNRAWARPYSRAEDDCDVALRYLDRSRHRTAMFRAFLMTIPGVVFGAFFFVAAGIWVWGSRPSRRVKAALAAALAALFVVHLWTLPHLEEFFRIANSLMSLTLLVSLILTSGRGLKLPFRIAPFPRRS